MLTIRPVSDLRNKFKAISKTVHRYEEPVFITKNGQSDMVVMSYDCYKKLETRLKLYEKLSVAETEDTGGTATYSLEEVIAEVKKSLGH